MLGSIVLKVGEAAIMRTNAPEPTPNYPHEPRISLRVCYWHSATGTIASNLRPLSGQYAPLARPIISGAIDLRWRQTRFYSARMDGARKSRNEAHMRFRCHADGVARIARRACSVRLPSQRH